MTPEPPPGYRLLTDEEKTKPLPCKPCLLSVERSVYNAGDVIVEEDRVSHYVTPVEQPATRATSELETLRVEVARIKSESLIAVETLKDKCKTAESELTRLRAELAEARRDGERVRHAIFSQLVDSDGNAAEKGFLPLYEILADMPEGWAIAHAKHLRATFDPREDALPVQDQGQKDAV